MIAETAKHAILFEWGDTLMRVFDDKAGPMAPGSRIEPSPLAATLLSGGTPE